MMWWRIYIAMPTNNVHPTGWSLNHGCQLLPNAKSKKDNLSNIFSSCVFPLLGSKPRTCPQLYLLFIEQPQQRFVNADVRHVRLFCRHRDRQCASCWLVHKSVVLPHDIIHPESFLRWQAKARRAHSSPPNANGDAKVPPHSINRRNNWTLWWKHLSTASEPERLRKTKPSNNSFFVISYAPCGLTVTCSSSALNRADWAIIRSCTNDKNICQVNNSLRAA